MKKTKKKSNLYRVEKPWGYYEDYFRNDKVVFKKIVVNPGENISYQIHNNRDEFWYIASGSGAFVIEDQTNDIIKAEDYPYGMTSYYIKHGWKHGIKNTGKDPLIIYEMQFGKPDEEDIFRLQDKYGREDEATEEEIENVEIQDNTIGTEDESD